MLCVCVCVCVCVCDVLFVLGMQKTYSTPKYSSARDRVTRIIHDTRSTRVLEYTCTRVHVYSVLEQELIEQVEQVSLRKAMQKKKKKPP